MIYPLPLNKLRTIGLLSIIAMVGASCGSYQPASYYDNDGIYSDDAPRTVERRPAQRPQQQYGTQPESNTYTDYFGQKAEQYDEILDSEIFTDVDSYASKPIDDQINQDQLTDYYNNPNDYEGYGGWGDNATNININFQNNGWGMGIYDPWVWNGGFGWGGGFGWNRWNNWGWGGGLGWGWGGGFGWNRWNNWGWGGGLGGNRWNNWG